MRVTIEILVEPDDIIVAFEKNGKYVDAEGFPPGDFDYFIGYIVGKLYELIKGCKRYEGS